MLVVDGNIGAGKSTLIRGLQMSASAHHVVQEPVDQWSQTLMQFYANQPLWAPQLQLLVTSTSIESIMRALLAVSTQTPPLLIADRSPWSALIFGRTLALPAHVIECMKMCINAYDRWLLERNVRCVRVYLRTAPHICAARIKERGRVAEQSIELSYLERLHEAHEEELQGVQCCLNGELPTQDLVGSLLQVLSDYV